MKKLLLPCLTVSSVIWGASFHVLAGIEVDSSEQVFSYTGVLKDFKLSESTYIVIKLWGDYLSYSFTVNRIQVKAEAPAFQGGMGLKFVTDFGIFSLIPGWERRNTNVSPDITGIQIKGISEGAIIVADAYIFLPRSTVLTLAGSYSTSISYAWGRIRIIKGNYFKYLRVGAEAISQGNYDYESFQIAPLLEFTKSNYSIIVRSGYKKSSAGESVYGGFELYMGF